VVAENEIILRRDLDAPRRLVFEAWTKPELLALWWGPKGFTLPTCEVDPRPRGAYRMVMRGPDGQEHGFEGVYREVVDPERLVFSAILDADPGHEMRVTVTFTGNTELTVHQVFVDHPATRGALEGWAQSLDKLALSLKGSARI
jgi:uncharacterized protein YndB with AHSA1/START domain